MMKNRDHNIIRHQPGDNNTCTERTKKKDEKGEGYQMAITATNTNTTTNTTMSARPRKPHQRHNPSQQISHSQSPNHRSKITKQRRLSSNNKQSSSSSSLPVRTTCHRRRLMTSLVSIASCMLMFYFIANIMSFNLLVIHHHQQQQQQAENEMLSVPHHSRFRNRNKSTTSNITNSTGFVRYSQRYNSNNNNNNNKNTHTEGYQKIENEKQQQLVTAERLKATRLYQNQQQESSDSSSVKVGTIKNKNNHTRKTIIFQRKYTKIIYFLHIHKSAGTYFCKQAFENRMSANYHMNCNVQDNQRCCGIDINGGSYNSQIEYAKSSTLDLVASEKEMYDIMIPQYYDYVVSLRHSQSRYYSHWLHLYRTAIEIYNKRYKFELKVQRNNNIRQQQQQQSKLFSSFLAWLALPLSWFSSSSSPSSSSSTTTTTTTKSMNMNMNTELLKQRRRQEYKHEQEQEQDQQGFDDNDVNDDPGHYNLTIRDQNGTFHPIGNYTKWILGQPDNYNVRMICGSRCIDVPKYQLTKELFNYTLERIWYNFSYIIFVEDMEESFNRFATAYGWNNNTNSSISSSSSTTRTEAETAIQQQQQRDKTTSTQTDKSSSSLLYWWDPYMSVLDDALYEFAKRKYYYDIRTDNAANNNSNNSNPEGTNSSSPSDLSASSSSSSSSSSSPLASLPLLEKFKNQDLVDQYFREGHSRNCTNACCGVCSKW